MRKTNDNNTKDRSNTTEASWNRVADRLKEWAYKEDSICIEDFITSPENCFDESVYYHSVKRFPKLKKMHDLALSRCGVNREKKAFKDNLSVNHATVFILPHYFDRWKEQIAWRAKLKDDNKGVTGPVTVVMDSFKDKDSK